MSNALFDALGIDEKDGIDTDEIAKIKKVVSAIRLEAALIAKGHETDDTVVMLDALLLKVKAFRREVSPEEARKIINARNAGEKIEFATGGDTSKLEQELAEANAAKQKLADDLKAMQDAATGSGTKALGGSSTDSIMEELEKHVAGDPARAKNILDLFKQLSGLSPDDFKARADIMGRIAYAMPNWELVVEPSSKEKLPSILVAALQKVADLGKDKVALEGQVKSQAKELDPFEKDSVAYKLAMADKAFDQSVDGTIGNKAYWFDFHADLTNVNGWAAKLAAAEKALADERDDAQATSLAGKLAAELKVRKPIQDALNTLDSKLDGVLEDLGDGNFKWGLVPATVKTARTKIETIKTDLRKAQKSKP